MRIAVAPADAHGCGFIRMIVPYRELAKHGHDVIFVDNPNDPRLEHQDVLVLQRQTSQQVYALALSLKAKGVKIVHEIDDNFHAMPPHNPSAAIYGTGKLATKMIEQFLTLADAVTVSTTRLGAEYSNFNERIKVCPNALDDEHFAKYARPITGDAKRSGQICIGWGGTATHYADMALVADPIARVMRMHPEVRFVIAGLGKLDHHQLTHAQFDGGAVKMRSLFPGDLWSRIEFAGATFSARNGFVPGDESNPDIGPVKWFDLLDSCDIDIGIAPLERNVFNACKSHIKVIEYGMLGIPAIASNVGPYQEYRGTGGPIRTPSDARAWMLALEQLITQPTLRQALAIANRQFVGQHHLISDAVKHWQFVFDALATQQAA